MRSKWILSMVILLITSVLAPVACGGGGDDGTPHDKPVSSITYGVTQDDQDSPELTLNTERDPDLRSSTGSLTLGEVTELIVDEVGPDGGTLIVDAPNYPLDGLTIQVSDGAYPAGTTFEIDSRTVESHSFGPDFNPASVLIEIDAGLNLAQDFVTMSIPVQIQPDEFAMAFAYEEETGVLQGLPLLESENDSVRIATRDISRDIIVSTVKLDRLDQDIDTGFQHGVDDWQFENYGSALSPRGHCAGQSLSAMYYFIEDLGPPLFGRYDNYDNQYIETPKLQWDDELAYRLASVAQESIDWDAASRWYWDLFADEHSDPGVYNAFTYSMLLTNAPQFVGIWSGTASAHAMIVYGKKGNSLLISDPNYPINTSGGADDRYIDFDPESEKFEPYNSGPTADELDTAYDSIIYFGYKDIIDWQDLGKLWDDLEEGVVGNVEFPDYRLLVRDKDSDVEQELWNNHKAGAQEILVRADAEFTPYLFIYDANGERITEGRTSIPVQLQKGDNFIGFEINALDSSDNPLWVGFDWVKIIYEEETPTVENEMKYVGTYSITAGECTSSGEFEFYIYKSGSATAKWRKQTDSCQSGFQHYPWQSTYGTHADGSFNIQMNKSVELRGTYNENSMSGSASSGDFSFSATRVQ